MIGLHWLPSLCLPASFRQQTFAEVFSTKTCISRLEKRAREGSLTSSVQTGHGPDKSAEKEILVLVQVANKSHIFMFYLCWSLVLILQFRLWFRERLRFSEGSVADLLLGNCTTGRKVETRVVFGELHRSDTGLTAHRLRQAQSCCSEPVLWNMQSGDDSSWSWRCNTYNKNTKIFKPDDLAAFSGLFLWNWSDVNINP